MVARDLIFPAENLRSIKWKGGSEVSLESIVPHLEKMCVENGINVNIYTDEINSGKMFDKSTTPCIVIENTDHRTDYNFYCITMKTQGIYAFIEFFKGGISKNASKLNSGNSLIGKIIKLGVKSADVDAEVLYYTIVEDILSEFFS